MGEKGVPCREVEGDERCMVGEGVGSGWKEDGPIVYLAFGLECIPQGR